MNLHEHLRTILQENDKHFSFFANLLVINTINNRDNVYLL